MAAKQKKNAATSKELMGAFEALGVPLVKATKDSNPDGCAKCGCLESGHHGKGVGCEGAGGNCGCDGVFVPKKQPVELTVEEACDPEKLAAKLLTKELDNEAENDIEAAHNETHRQGFAVVGLAVLLHKATCHRYHFDKVDCAFEGGKKFEALQVAQARALWIDYATQIANLSGVEAAQQTMALIFGKGSFAALGKSRYYTKEERAAYEAKNAAKKQELTDFLKGYAPGATGDATAKPSADDQKFTQTYAGGTPEQLDEEVNKEQQADIKKFLGEE